MAYASSRTTFGKPESWQHPMSATRHWVRSCWLNSVDGCVSGEERKIRHWPLTASPSRSCSETRELTQRTLRHLGYESLLSMKAQGKGYQQRKTVRRHYACCLAC